MTINVSDVDAHNALAINRPYDEHQLGQGQIPGVLNVALALLKYFQCPKKTKFQKLKNYTLAYNYKDVGNNWLCLTSFQSTKSTPKPQICFEDFVALGVFKIKIFSSFCANIWALILNKACTDKLRHVAVC